MLPLNMNISPLAVSNQFGYSSQTDVFYVSQGTLKVAYVTGSATYWPRTTIASSLAWQPYLAASQQFSELKQTNLYVVDSGGNLNVFATSVGAPWGEPQIITAPTSFPPGAPIAVSNHIGTPYQTDLFIVDQNGNLFVFQSVETGVWTPVQITTSSPAVPGAFLAASQQFGVNQTDVFLIDDDGNLTVYYSYKSSDYVGPVTIDGSGSFPPGAPIAVTQQFGTSAITFAFAISNSGGLVGYAVVGSQQWAGPYPVSGPMTFYPGGFVAASNQFGLPDQTNVYAVNTGSCLYTYWILPGGTSWTPLQITGVIDPFSPIAATQRFGTTDQTDVYAYDSEGRLSVTSVIDSGEWSPLMVI